MLNTQRTSSSESRNRGINCIREMKTHNTFNSVVLNVFLGQTWAATTMTTQSWCFRLMRELKTITHHHPSSHPCTVYLPTNDSSLLVHEEVNIPTNHGSSGLNYPASSRRIRSTRILESKTCLDRAPVSYLPPLDWTPIFIQQETSTKEGWMDLNGRYPKQPPGMYKIVKNLVNNRINYPK